MDDTPVTQAVAALHRLDTRPCERTAAPVAQAASCPDTGRFERTLRAPDVLARYLSFNDRGHEERDSAVLSMFPDSLSFPYRDADTSFLSRHHGTFDLMVIGGADLVRVAGALRRNAILLRRCAKIAISRDCQPRKVAKALNAGFDDVIDLATTEPEEIAARTRAILARYGTARPGEIGQGVAAIVDRSRLSPREQELVTLLAERVGYVVPYQALQDRIAERVPSLSIEHLRVIVSKLRPKLNSGYAIVPEKGCGYRLVSLAETATSA
jgi:hypothetical protein